MQQVTPLLVAILLLLMAGAIGLDYLSNVLGPVRRPVGVAGRIGWKIGRRTVGRLVRGLRWVLIGPSVSGRRRATSTSRRSRR